MSNYYLLKLFMTIDLALIKYVFNHGNRLLRLFLLVDVCQSFKLLPRFNICSS